MTPASIRNRNPGAIYPGPSAKKFGSTSYETLRSKDGVHKIATFPSATHGGAALFHLLHEGRDPISRKLRYRDRTLRQAIETWCGGYYAPTYCKVVTSHCDVGADDVLTTDLIRDPQRAIALGKAMALQEAGTPFPMSDHDWLEAHEMAFVEAAAPGWTPKNDVPTRNPEDKLESTLKRVVAPVAAGGAVVTEAVRQGVPAVPEVATKSLEHIGAWKRVGGGVIEVGKEAVGVVALTGRLWPYVVGAGLGGVVLALAIWKRRNAETPT